MQRQAANTLKVSAAAIAAWLAYEGFSPEPYIPVKGDRPTIGHGSTYYPDGRPVRMGDPPISRSRALEIAAGELDKTFAACVRDSLGDAPISQTEFDIAVDFAGQYGCARWTGSAMHAAYMLGEYAQACQGYLQYRNITSDKSGGAGWVRMSNGRYKFDCATPGNKECAGVWTRQKERHSKCSASLLG